ncbi:flagellar hook capping FlgD N-terminal domain-containing protein [[Clostridium] polysaccharolyticum]|uniref:Basal-body rod modification protein FlgD n=1 Tax=[Clostridium] polysaccharolyticum TaxID=29364 RepID=A0A1H9Y1Y5_9FIRM|nr:flagellar hook capping FlgD N-terminal domain-containing protein [[Clostridium] polysaccharolyticum]SES62788.1 flagellar basal-body rod modification protein FlgD [[Clostridium] polysaccharolyticum]
MGANLSAPVKDGVVQQYTSDVMKKKETRGTSALGKDAFLQLLCTQMQYQDPLNPASDTEFISQLASFSSLEQMQNLNNSFAQTQAFTMIGQEVQVKADNKEGFIQGVVDYVTVSEGKANFSIDGVLYPSDKLISVISPLYSAKQNAPSVPEQKFEFNHEKPSDLNIKMDLGKDTGAASSFAVVLNGKAVDKSMMGFDAESNTVTISKDALKDLQDGSYKIMIVFNDQLETSVTDKVSVTVSGKPKTDEGSETADTEKKEDAVTDKE